MVYDVAILGAGASGLMLSTRLQNQNICIIDANNKIGEKIRISGGGKCNITNKYLSVDKYSQNTRLLDHIFKNFDNDKLLSMLEQNGVKTSFNERLVKGALFCKNSLDVIAMFEKLIKKQDFLLNTKVIDVDVKSGIFYIQTDKNIIKAEKLVVASGGLSFPILGASDIGYKIATKFGHNISTTNPALVGWSVQKEQFWFKELSGLSLKDVEITVGDKKYKGDFLFTHRGCSGPVVLVSSLYWSKGLVSVDFLASGEEVPKRFRQAFGKFAKGDMRGYTFAPAGTFGYSKAEVTKGGVSINELTSKMESKYQKNLYFIGEVLDITGELGGYNLQFAFSSAMKVVV
jgi:predicted Rossmann fold flavoprotein